MKTNENSFAALAANEGRIHFAGEATNEPFHGAVHAAQVSGIREDGLIVRWLTVKQSNHLTIKKFCPFK